MPAALQQMARLLQHRRRPLRMRRAVMRRRSEAGTARRTSVMQDLAAALHAALGALERAEELLDRAIARKPNLYGAYQMRADLRRQTSSPIMSMQSGGAERSPPPKGISAFSYALAKELEDLGEFDKVICCPRTWRQGPSATRCSTTCGRICRDGRIRRSSAPTGLRMRLWPRRRSSRSDFRHGPAAKRHHIDRSHPVRRILR